jgi:hypothetical protein
MEIATIMQRIGDSVAADTAGIKTASAPEPNTAPSAEALRTELRQVLSQGHDPQKTASAPSAPVQGSPSADLVKMANDLANAEEEALLKQAQVYGAAMCDGFMTRYAQYEQAANEIAPEQPKTAAATPAAATVTAEADFNKFASENPEITREAYDLGYRTKMAALKEEANERFGAGYNDTMQEIHKTASDLYKHGTEWAQWAVKQAEYQRSQQIAQ